MILTLWFIVKTTILISAFMWLMAIGGVVTISLYSMTVIMPFGVFVVVTLFVFWCLSVILRFLRAIVNVPRSWRAYNEKRSMAIGLQSLANGLSAIAAKDIKAANHFAKRTSRYLANDFGLPDMMQAMAASLSGDKKQAQISLNNAMNNKEISYFGLKGLINLAIEKSDYRYARVLAKRAYDKNPKQKWFVDMLYDLDCKTANYESALTLLKKTSKLAIEKKQDMAFLYFGLGDVAKAYKIAPLCLPIGLAALKYWVDSRRKSLSIIRKLWLVHPHPKLMDYWILHAPKKAKDNPLKLVSWVEELCQSHTVDAPSYLYAAEAIHAIGQSEQAKRFLSTSMAMRPTMRAHKLMHKIDSMGGWMDNVALACDDEAWVCLKTGRVYDDWCLVTPDYHFNSVVWGYPDSIRQSMLYNNHLQTLLSV